MQDFEGDFGSTRAAYFDYLTTRGASGETGLEELWQGNLWKKREDAMVEAAGLDGSGS